MLVQLVAALAVGDTRVAPHIRVVRHSRVGVLPVVGPQGQPGLLVAVQSWAASGCWELQVRSLSQDVVVALATLELRTEG